MELMLRKSQNLPVNTKESKKLLKMPFQKPNLSKRWPRSFLSRY